MLTTEEKKFVEYWDRNREKDKNVFRQLRYGLPLGLFIGILIILNFISGWYSRAVMVANSQSTPLVLLAGVVIIIIFWSIFSKQHSWDMNEQRYKELQFKDRKDKIKENMQQDEQKTGLDKKEIEI